MRIKRLITGSNGTPKAPKRITQIEEMKSECERRREGGKNILVNVVFVIIDNTHNQTKDFCSSLFSVSQ